ncbi:MAG TPA: gluconokinase [Phenylobacterium sp.]
MRPPDPMVIVVMGVSGVGKTTVSEALAKRCGFAFIDGDTLHPKANIEKMSSGRPLNDADRAPWLGKVKDWIDAQLAEGRSGVVSCSALKRKYRSELVSGRADVRLVLLEGTRALLAERLAGRMGHFMPPTLLDSQLADLEQPDPSEHVTTIDVGPPADQIVDQIVAALGLKAARPTSL